MRCRVCAKDGCGRTAAPGKRYCDRHSGLEGRGRQLYTRRGESGKWHRLYNSAEWRRRSAEFLRKYPVCFVCGGKATVADHIIPHRGDIGLFMDDGNLQPMCQRCHSRKTLAENGYFRRGSTPRG